MKKVDLSDSLIRKTTEALEDIEQEVFGQVKTDLRAGAGCLPGSCPRPLYGVPTSTS